MAMSGKLYQLIIEALLEAFPNPHHLQQMLKFRLNRNLYAISMGSDYRTILFDLVVEADSHNFVPELILAARASNPGNPELFQVAQLLNLAVLTPDGTNLERIIQQKSSFIDPAAWRSELAQMENRVCRIEIDLGNMRFMYGTGFLVGEDQLLTNYHVMETVIKGEVGSEQVTLRFDCKTLPNGKTDHGTVFRLADDLWLIDCSPMSWVDSMPDPKPAIPTENELDYALLRLKDSPGIQPIGHNPEPSAPCRGWITMPSQPVTVSENMPLAILQHPSGGPLKLAFDTNSVIGKNANGTRIRYRTNTEPGSSGSPCFNLNWDLVALHHSGDPNFTFQHTPEYNEGIPIEQITQRLRHKSFL